MANNRLYLVDTETGDKLLLAKGWGEWQWHPNTDEMTAWLKGRDIGATSGPDGQTSCLKLVTE
jgi:hypothetical protein